MSITTHTIIWGSVSGSRQNVRYDFLDHTGGHTLIDKLVPIGFDANTDALSMYTQIEQQLADSEISEAISKVDARQNPDKTAEHNTQENFDRRVLGYIMTVEDPHKTNVCLPFWSALQIRNGANASQRAANLGVPIAEYNECEARLDTTIGASSFLASDLASIWTDIKEDWQ